MNRITSNSRRSDTDHIPFDTPHETHLKHHLPAIPEPTSANGDQPPGVQPEASGLLDARVRATKSEMCSC